MKNLQNSAYILFIGLSPLIFQYGKTLIDQSSFARNIKNQILLKHQISLSEKCQNQKNKQTDYITINDVEKAIQQSKSESKLNQNQKIQLQMLKQWMKIKFSFQSISVQKNIAISMMHLFGGFFSPNIFFFSICGYFVLYQASFLRQFLGIKNGIKIQNGLTFDKLNNIYLGFSGVVLALVGARMGLQKLSKRAYK